MSNSYFTLHKFRPTETVDAVMRLLGRHNYTSAELVVLRKRFNELNGAIIPKPGEIFKIPLELITVDDFGSVVDVSANFPINVDSSGKSLDDFYRNTIAQEKPPEIQVPVVQPTLSVSGGRRRTPRPS